MRFGFLMVTTMLLVQGCNPATNDITADTTTIDVEDNQFVPKQDTVTAGSGLTATVTFVWENGNVNQHNVTWDMVPGGGTLPASPNLTSGATYDATLGVGTYTYHCSIHGSAGAGMHGAIEVR